jgi:hypothetical protein
MSGEPVRPSLRVSVEPTSTNLEGQINFRVMRRKTRYRVRSESGGAT